MGHADTDEEACERPLSLLSINVVYLDFQICELLLNI